MEQGLLRNATAAPTRRGSCGVTLNSRVSKSYKAGSRAGSGDAFKMRSFAPNASDFSLSGNNAGLDLWSQGIVDCEDTSCGLVPDGAVILIPFGKQPAKREERIALLEAGVELSDESATFVGAVDQGEVNFVVDSPVVSGKHARIEAVLEEDSPKAFGKLFGFVSEEKYYLTDLNSTNGTFLNRGRLRPLFPVEIKPGDVVAFGSMDNSYRVVKAQARKGFVF
ncbi:hypothetical protein BSKO_13374 [Bryopsis sp. KO-2023]|nr:hypothetical protein BSKO_13374 [Bryopsis sp. KO-2023]